jgi:hypothetical protein
MMAHRADIAATNSTSTTGSGRLSMLLMPGSVGGSRRVEMADFDLAEAGQIQSPEQLAHNRGGTPFAFEAMPELRYH